jgi:hypothetical protein
MKIDCVFFAKKTQPTFIKNPFPKSVHQLNIKKNNKKNTLCAMLQRVFAFKELILYPSVFLFFTLYFSLL